MALDPQLLQQVLHTPADRDVSESPIVRAVILPDATNAAALVPALEDDDTLVLANARRILAGFGPDAVAPLLSALGPVGANARREGLEAVFALLVGEDDWTIRDALTASKDAIDALLDDRESVPDSMPEYIERDFRGRLCDFAYIVVKRLSDPQFEQSSFRALDDRGRDEAIRKLKSSGIGLRVV